MNAELREQLRENIDRELAENYPHIRFVGVWDQGALEYVNEDGELETVYDPYSRNETVLMFEGPAHPVKGRVQSGLPVSNDVLENDTFVDLLSFADIDEAMKRHMEDA